MTDLRMHYTAILADDHTIVRLGLKTALEQGDLLNGITVQIVAEAADGLQTIEAVKAKRPDLLILDVSMPIASGAEIVADIMRWSPGTKIVVYSAITSPGLLAQLIETGVHGLFAQGSDAAALRLSLSLLFPGGVKVGPAFLAAVRRRPPPARQLPALQR